jgi:hypothetical protein
MSPRPLTNRDIRRAFGPEAMQVIADLSARVDRLEASLAAVLIREQANYKRQLEREIAESERVGEATV